MTDAERINDELERRPPGRKVAAFFVHDTHVTPTEWMDGLAAALRERGWAAVGLLTPQSAPLMRFTAMDADFVVNPADVAAIRGADCFIVTDLDGRTDYPAESRVLAFLHSTSVVADPGCFLQGAHATGSFDGYAVCFPIAARAGDILRAWTDFAPPHRRRRPAGDFHLMACGSPRLCLTAARLRRLREEEGVTPRDICYAPVFMDDAPWQGGARMEGDGPRIIRRMLDAFPDRAVIFRPAPQDRGRPTVLRILELFAGEERLVPDMENSYLRTFARTAAMVTDFSHIGTSFHTATRRASAHFQPWTGRDAVGLPLSFCATLDALEEAVRLACAAAESDTPLPSPAGVLPFENAIDELAEAVIDFAAGRPHADWLAIPRTNTGPGAPAGRIIRALLEMEPSTQQNLSAFHAWYFRSRALAAFGLLLRRRHSPDLPCSRALLELSRHPEPAPARGGDVRPDVLAGMLVEEAALARRAGDMETALILAELAALAR